MFLKLDECSRDFNHKISFFKKDVMSLNFFNDRWLERKGDEVYLESFEREITEDLHFWQEVGRTIAQDKTLKTIKYISNIIIL